MLAAPFFSNPGLLRTGLRSIRSATVLVDRYMSRYDVTGARAILVGHAHYDHLMDVPRVARSHAPNARIVGNATVKNTLGTWSGVGDRVDVVNDIAGDQHTSGEWLRLSGDPPDMWREGIAGYSITPGFMGTVGTRLVQGRDIELQDGPNAQFVALVNETFVRTALDDVDPIGLEIRHVGTRVRHDRSASSGSWKTWSRPARNKDRGRLSTSHIRSPSGPSPRWWFAYSFP